MDVVLNSRMVVTVKIRRNDRARQEQDGGNNDDGNDYDDGENVDNEAYEVLTYSPMVCNILPRDAAMLARSW